MKFPQQEQLFVKLESKHSKSGSLRVPELFSNVFTTVSIFLARQQGDSVKRARKRQIKLFVQRRTTFAEALMRMPNVGMDADFERVDTVVKMLQFMRDARPMTTSLDLKQSKDESRA